jgi:hypothetical protein
MQTRTPNPAFNEPSSPLGSWDAVASCPQNAVESAGASGANGIAPDAGRHEPDPDWQPL